MATAVTWQPQPPTGLFPAHRDVATAVATATVPMATARDARAHVDRTHSASTQSALSQHSASTQQDFFYDNE